MKKILSIAMMLLVTIISSAQEVEKLSKINIEGDELLGTKPSVLWVSDHVRILQEDDEFYICLKIKNHIFIDTPFKIAFYDKNDNLVINCYMWSARLTDDHQMARLVENGFTRDSIPGVQSISDDRYLIPSSTFIKYAMSHEGYIRFVTYTYGDYLYDIRALFAKEN